MSNILSSVDQRTQLVGQNRLELLLFRLNGKQRFGINVFKVREVLQCPPLTTLPKLHHTVRGVAHIRGQTISVIDISLATGGEAISDLQKCFIIISEYNRSIQGFLVGSVERIINMNWESILPPPKGAGNINYMTAVTEVDNELVEILDVEKILNEISPFEEDVSEEIKAEGSIDIGERVVLVADDSSVARRQVQRALKSLGLNAMLACDGKEAYDMLLEMIKDERPIREKVALLISDIEMPEMDGYTLTTACRNNPGLKDLQIILHSSLSGVFNEAMVDKVGANNFIAKFNPDDLARAVKEAMDAPIHVSPDTGDDNG